jgi:hypothetical protein
MMTSKEMLSDSFQGSLRDRVWDKMCTDKLGFVVAARSMNVSQVTLHQFISQERKVGRITVIKLLEWLDPHWTRLNRKRNNEDK